MSTMDNYAASLILDETGRPFDLEQRSGLANPAEWLEDALGGRASTSGERVNNSTALAISAFYACVRVIAEDVAKLPLKIYRRMQPRGKAPMPDHPMWKVLHDSPNPNMTSFTFRETMTQHALAWGGGYAEIVKQGENRAVELYPIDPTTVSVEVVNGVVFYDVRQGNGTKARISADRMLHIQGMSFDGMSGYQLVQLAKESLGSAIAAQKFGAAFFGNGTWLGGVLEHPGTLSETAMAALRKSFESRHQGADKAYGTGILQEGMKWQSTSIEPQKAQMVEFRHFTVEDVCRWFRVPPHKIQHLLRATFSNIEQQALEYVGDTLMPWLVRWEQEINRRLLNDLSGGDVFAEHLVAGLLRGDQVSRGQFYAQRFNMGSLSPNDIRELENENPVEGGDVYLIPMNMQRLDDLDEEVLPPVPEPEPEPESEPELDDDDDQDRAARIRALCESLQPILRDAYSRLVKMEANRAIGAMKRGTFPQWLPEFADGHVTHVVSVLAPAIEAVRKLIHHVCGNGEDETGDATTLVRDMANRHIAAMRLGLERNEAWCSEEVVERLVGDEIDELIEMMEGLYGANEGESSRMRLRDPVRLPA